MPSARITAWAAHVRHRNGDAGCERLIVLTHEKPGKTPQVFKSKVMFRTPESKFVTKICEKENSVEAELPIEAYNTWVDILRNENPILLNWTTAAEALRKERQVLTNAETAMAGVGEEPIIRLSTCSKEPGTSLRCPSSPVQHN